MIVRVFRKCPKPHCDNSAVVEPDYTDSKAIEISDVMSGLEMADRAKETVRPARRPRPLELLRHLHSGIHPVHALGHSSAQQHYNGTHNYDMLFHPFRSPVVVDSPPSTVFDQAIPSMLSMRARPTNQRKGAATCPTAQAAGPWSHGAVVPKHLTAWMVGDRRVLQLAL